MSDLKNARMVLGLARDDLVALQEMKGSARISDRTLGFHGQQAVEKALKAWLALLDVDYPKTHDLDELLALLDEKHQVVPRGFRALAYLTDYAVLLRYGIPDQDGGGLDRSALVREVSDLVQHVERLVAEEISEGQ